MIKDKYTDNKRTRSRKILFVVSRKSVSSHNRSAKKGSDRPISGLTRQRGDARPKDLNI